jgi:hypothetical protein
VRGQFLASGIFYDAVRRNPNVHCKPNRKSYLVASRNVPVALKKVTGFKLDKRVSDGHCEATLSLSSSEPLHDKSSLWASPEASLLFSNV